MPPLNLLIKPASSGCNMSCDYCFYVDEARHRKTASYGIMTSETLEAVISKALAFADHHCVIGFQGGEPTLAGLEFFRYVVALQHKYRKPGQIVENAIQTNGYAFNAEWAEFLADNNFLVGLSLDGPKDIHDRYRVDHGGKGTFRQVLRTVELLRGHKVEFNVLTVVTAQTAKKTDAIYGFFKKNKLDYQQYIPCLDPLEEERGRQTYSLTPELYGGFLKALFQQWYLDRMNGRFVYIRYFENLMSILAGKYPESCGMLGRCANQWIVEADGSVYPCDFSVLDQWRLGNLMTDSMENIAANSRVSEFIGESLAIHGDCKNCEWATFCRGGCRREREILPGDTAPKNYFCEAYKTFFAYSMPKFRQVMNRWYSGQAPKEF